MAQDTCRCVFVRQRPSPGEARVVVARSMPSLRRARRSGVRRWMGPRRQTRRRMGECGVMAAAARQSGAGGQCVEATNRQGGVWKCRGCRCIQTAARKACGWRQLRREWVGKDGRWVRTATHGCSSAASEPLQWRMSESCGPVRRSRSGVPTCLGP